MQKVKKVEIVTQEVRDLGQQQQQKWVCFWGLWRPGSQGRISATVTAAAICITLILNKVNLQYISFVKKAFLYCCWIRIKCKRLFNQQHCSSRRESSSASLWRLQQLLLWSWNQVGPAWLPSVLPACWTHQPTNPPRDQVIVTYLFAGSATIKLTNNYILPGFCFATQKPFRAQSTKSEYLPAYDELAGLIYH